MSGYCFNADSCFPTPGFSMKSVVFALVLAAFGSVSAAMAGSSFYAGVQGGGAWGDADKFFPDFGTKRVPVDIDGFVFGAHAGVDFDFGKEFVGAEASIAFTDIDGGNITPGGVSCSSSVPPIN
jgi:opacity protein-like surface antigen